MNRAVALLFFMTATAVYAAEPPCSIHPPKGAPKSAPPSMANITQADAQKAALAEFDAAAGAKVAEGELESEGGCLIYSFDVRVAGGNAMEEISVDAGTGKVLSRRHETAEQEADEED